MAREQELKLAIAESSWGDALGWLETRGGNRVLDERLKNIYFDTADARLNRERVALRIRQSGGGYTQTLKTKGTSVAGLHDRQEWDWAVNKAELDIEVLRESPVAEIVAQASLQPVFSTDFDRNAWLWRDGGQAIEFALDRGEVRSGNAGVAISEIELELKEGEPETLLVQAEALSRVCPVFLNPVSKAEQGYFVAGLYRPRALVLMGGENSQTMVDAWFQSLGYFALTGETLFLKQAAVTLERLAEKEQSGSGKLARHGLTPPQWRKLIELQSSWTPGAPEQVRSQLLTDPLLGQCQLMLAVT